MPRKGPAEVDRKKHNHGTRGNRAAAKTTVPAKQGVPRATGIGGRRVPECRDPVGQILKKRNRIHAPRHPVVIAVQKKTS